MFLLQSLGWHPKLFAILYSRRSASLLHCCCLYFWLCFCLSSLFRMTGGHRRLFLFLILFMVNKLCVIFRQVPCGCRSKDENEMCWGSRSSRRAPTQFLAKIPLSCGKHKKLLICTSQNRQGAGVRARARAELLLVLLLLLRWLEKEASAAHPAIHQLSPAILQSSCSHPARYAASTNL